MDVDGFPSSNHNGVCPAEKRRHHLNSLPNQHYWYVNIYSSQPRTCVLQVAHGGWQLLQCAQRAGHAAVEEAGQLGVDALQVAARCRKLGGELLRQQRVDLANGLQQPGAVRFLTLCQMCYPSSTN
jgi:hypothetical protein